MAPPDASNKGPAGDDLPNPRPSMPLLAAVKSAARAQPLAPAPEPEKLARERIQEGLLDTLLNSVSILREMAEDFRNSDRFFKYKASVLGAWLFLSVASLGVACPSQGPSNDIGARLIENASTNPPAFSVKNDGSEPWQNVIITVNGKYRSTVTVIDAHGGDITLSSPVLFDDSGKVAPGGLRITDIQVQVAEPEATVTLLQNGQALK